MTVNWAAISSLITGLAALGALIFTGQAVTASQEQVAIAQAQNQLAEQGQITDRYGKAVEQIGQEGPEHLQLRLGGIYSLERIAHDSPRDQPTILEVLLAFIRTNTHANFVAPAGSPIRANNTCSTLPTTGPDIQAALAVIGRRDVKHDDYSRINLSKACLRGARISGRFDNASLDYADLSGANLSGADFNHSTFLYTIFNGGFLLDANFDHAQFPSASFLGTYLYRSNLKDARLNGANLTNGLLNDARLNGADLTAANFTNSILRGVDLTGVRHDATTSMGGAQTDGATRGMWW
ncbi:pentapeptide repeat-containing protein [Amycolatopsis camponoti]|nr:pentapeptide repeat-containing protein [Amycolatopsis camponoti]